LSSTDQQLLRISGGRRSDTTTRPDPPPVCVLASKVKSDDGFFMSRAAPSGPAPVAKGGIAQKGIDAVDDQMDPLVHLIPGKALSQHPTDDLLV